MRTHTTTIEFTAYGESYPDLLDHGWRIVTNLLGDDAERVDWAFDLIEPDIMTSDGDVLRWKAHAHARGLWVN